MDDTFRFPKRVYDALRELDSDARGDLYDIICAYCFGSYNLDEIEQTISELESYEIAIFKLIVPLLDDANFIYKS